MFGPFGPGDSLRVYRLQHKGLSLDLERDLTRAHTPLWEAWLAYLSQQAMGQPTYVLYDAHDGEAFVQVQYRPHQAAADVSFIAPALAESRRVAQAWSSLLDGACVDAGARGIQRVFANLPEAGPEVEVFHQAGFALYGGEDVYRRAPSSVRGVRQSGQDLPLRPRCPEDWPALQKLCVAITPQRVRQAEGGIAVTTTRGRNCQWYVLDGRDGADLAAAVSVCVGGSAHWLRVLIHPESGPPSDGLIEWGLSAITGRTAAGRGDRGASPSKLVYCSVRRFEGGVRGALDDLGFELYASRALMVKHTVAWIKTPAQELVPALKGGAEPVPPAYRIHSETTTGPYAETAPARRGDPEPTAAAATGGTGFQIPDARLALEVAQET